MPFLKHDRTSTYISDHDSRHLLRTLRVFHYNHLSTCLVHHQARALAIEIVREPSHGEAISTLTFLDQTMMVQRVLSFTGESRISNNIVTDPGTNTTQIHSVHRSMCSGTRTFRYRTRTAYLASHQIPNMVFHTCHHWPRHGNRWVHQSDSFIPEEPIRRPLLRYSIFLHRCRTCHVQRKLSSIACSYCHITVANQSLTLRPQSTP